MINFSDMMPDKIKRFCLDNNIKWCISCYGFDNKVTYKFYDAVSNKTAFVDAATESFLIDNCDALIEELKEVFDKKIYICEIVLVPIKEYAEHRGIPLSTLRNHINKGLYPGAVKKNNRWYITVQERKEKNQVDLDELVMDLNNKRLNDYAD